MSDVMMDKRFVLAFRLLMGWTFLYAGTWQVPVVRLLGGHVPGAHQDVSRCLPRDLRVIGWTFLFWVAVAAAAAALMVRSGCSGWVRVDARADVAVSPGEGADRG